jgi:hydroxylamine dehydrogenase
MSSKRNKRAVKIHSGRCPNKSVKKFGPQSGIVLTIIGLLALSFCTIAHAHPEVDLKELYLELSKEAIACIECHKKESPGITADWGASVHAKVGITCITCHKCEVGGAGLSTGHYKQYQRSDYNYGTSAYRVPVAALVSPLVCARCHFNEVKEYSRSKHANTLELIWKIDPWLRSGMTSETERITGCFVCHGSIIKVMDGKITSEGWPNVGVGRINVDGSRGSCTSCHTRHKFSRAEARKPEACGQCHLGPDHPQAEIYNESIHGAIYRSEGDQWNWNAPTREWIPGQSYRSPTCAVCHMCKVGTTAMTHDVTERLSWELQAPYTVRPSDFEPFPAKTDWKAERNKMKAVCLQCHGKLWVDNHYIQLDLVIKEYNDVYFKPAQDMLLGLYKNGLLDKSVPFDEQLEIEFYEFWHYAGRRARMGAAMMAPGYTWWRGFYECKKRYNTFMEEARKLLLTKQPACRYQDVPNATGNPEVPAEVRNPFVLEP